MAAITDSKYDKVRNQCLAEGKLWEDPDFPADDTSIGPKPSKYTITWKRPHVISGKGGIEPEFILDRGDRFDVVQGGLGDCWMLAAAASLTNSPELFKRMVPHDQTFGKPKYAGVFRFHFWKYGKWVEVLVDDRLPTITYGRLIYASASPLNEFWGPLLEKAYAKFYGNYQYIEAGFGKDALTDFTGCMAQTTNMVDCTVKDLRRILFKATARNAILNANVEEPEDAEEKGLITGHAYSVTGVKQVTLDDNTKVCLVRIRNPWGDEHEWKGRWSDSSNDWEKISAEQQKEMRLEKKADGEFWMQLNDFIRYFSDVEICYLDTIDWFDSPGGPKCWSISTFYGKWIKNETAGGWNVHSPSFAKNPQFKVTLNDCDDDDDMASVVFELTQMYRRREQLKDLKIGFYVYRILPGEKLPLSKDYLEDIKHIEGKADYTSFRSLVKSFTMKPGNYAIIPSTRGKNQVGEFMLRVFSETDHQSHEING